MSMPHYHSHTNYSKISILPFRSNYVPNKQTKKINQEICSSTQKKKKKKPQTLFFYLKGSSESTTCQVSIPPFPAKSFPPKRKPTTTLRDPPLSKLDFAPFPSKLQTHTHSCSPHFLPRERERDVWLGRGRRVLQRPSSLMARRPRRHRRPGGRRQPPLRPPEAKGVHPWLRDRQKRVPLQRKPGPQP